MPYRVLTRTVLAETYLTLAIGADENLQRFDSDKGMARKELLGERSRLITNARREGVSLAELAQAFGKSIEWVRQAEKKGAKS